MDSRAKMLIGLILVAVGAFVTYVTYSAAAGGGRFVVAWGAIAVGAVTFLTGLVQHITADSSGQVDRALPTATPEFKALLRAMISASELDGPLDADKIHIIGDRAFKITREEPYANTIKDVAAGMAKERARGIKTSDYLAQVQSTLTIEVKKLVLQTSAEILVNSEQRRAAQFLQEMADALGLTAQQRQEACGGVARPAAASA